MSAQLLKVMVVANERDTLRRFSWLLAEFGYRVLASTDVGGALSSLQLASPDLLIVDAQAIHNDPELIREIRRLRARPYLYLLLLCGPEATVDVMEAVEAGVDDILEKPINSGEVLARLRAGARYLEFERRAEVLLGADPLTGLRSTSAILERLRCELSGSAEAGACLLLDLDLFHCVNRAYGSGAGDQLLVSIAQRIQQSCGSCLTAARLQADRFCILLPGMAPDLAHEWAERLRHDLAEAEHHLSDAPLRLTASLGMCTWNRGSDDPLSILQQATEALEMAKHSGRNCLICVGEWEPEHQQWSKLVSEGNPFVGSRARDVMTPFTLWLRPTETAGEAAAKFHRCGLEILPVIDQGGNLQGLLHQRDLPGGPADAEEPVARLLSHDVRRVGEDMDFAAVMEHFGSHPDTALAVVQGELPRGFITRDRFLALVSPVTADSFQPDSPYPQNSGHLLVADSTDREVSLADA